MDRIEVKLGEEENSILVHMNVPVRYVSHVVNQAGTEIDLQLQVIQTPDVDIEELLTSHQLTWNPSAEMPLDKVVFQGRVVGPASMQVSFASPVENFQVRQGKNFDVVEFVLKRKKKVVEVPVRVEPKVEIDVPETRPPLPVRELPAGIFVINLSSQRQPIDLSHIAPIPLDGGLTLYSTQIMIDGLSWYRLRLGFFATMEDAKSRLKALKNFYPSAWIDRSDVDERRQALEIPKGTPLPPLEEQPGKPKVKPPTTKLPVADTRLAKMMTLTRRTMTAGEYAKAVRMLEAILEEPDNPYEKEARELLGLARERNGQLAHAKAEYRIYLERYPEGEDAERVRQRLLGLVTATQQPKAPLRQQKERKLEAEWETYGSFSQNYRRDTIDSPFVEEEDSVSRSEIETFLDFNTRRRGEDYDLRMKLTTSYIHDMLNEDQGDGDESTLSDAYLDLEHRNTRTSMRVGRQRLRSSGILNRFDGLVLGYELTPDVRIRAAGGLPVERSKDVYLHEHKTFAGINGDISNLFENWDLSLFFVEQRVDDLIDRRAVGGELRYFDPNHSLFSLLDYDIHYSSLNTFMLQGNWTLEDQTRLYMNLDYRNSPVLMTTNALSGQTEPVSLLPIETIDDLQTYYTEDEIYDLALDRTAQTSTVSLGASRPFTPTLQLSGDVTVTRTGDTPASGGVEAVEGTGNEYFYTFQVVKNDLLKKGDIGIFSVRYSDASTSNTVRLSASSRYPLTTFWRINPKFSVSYREDDDGEGSRLMVSPFIQMDYRLRKSFTLEFEAGLNWFEEDDGLETTNYTDYFIIAGYRWDF
jgi:hypothetical protein